MPGNNQGFWGTLRNIGSEGVDRLFLNNRGYNHTTGEWSGQGAAEGGIQTGLNRLVPGLGYLFGKGVDQYHNTYTQPTATDYANNAPADSPSLYGMYTGQQYGGGQVGGTDLGYGAIPNYGGLGGNGQIGGIAREPFPVDTRTQQPSNPYGGGYIPTMPQVTAQGQGGGWQGLGTSTGNVFHGGALGSWANGSNVQNNTAAALAGGGRGTATQGHQWTGLSGDAARSYFGGLSTASTDAAQYEAMMEMAKQRQ